MPFRDILLALLVIFIWGGNIVAIKIGVTELPPPIILTIRFALTGLIFLIPRSDCGQHTARSTGILPATRQHTSLKQAEQWCPIRRLLDLTMVMNGKSEPMCA